MYDGSITRASRSTSAESSISRRPLARRERVWANHAAQYFKPHPSRAMSASRILRPNVSDATVRDASEDDAPACAAIYAPYVRETAISFEGEPPTPANPRICHAVCVD
jgi:hypothetical protein